MLGCVVAGQGCWDVWGSEKKNLVASRWMITGMGSMFTVSCKWELGVGLQLQTGAA